MRVGGGTAVAGVCAANLAPGGHAILRSRKAARTRVECLGAEGLETVDSNGRARIVAAVAERICQ